MLLRSLGPEAIAALLRGEGRREFSGPDLSWLLFGPDTDPAETVPVGPKGDESVPLKASEK
jgi:hypothetical protein